MSDQPRQVLRCQKCRAEMMPGSLNGWCQTCNREAGATVPPPARTEERVDHPAHYGGKDDPYEAIKVIRAWRLSFSLGNAVKYICRAGRKPGAETVEDLKKARWYLDEEIRHLEGNKERP